MRIGYCSPFSPIKSGISDFSEELVFALKKHISIDLFYDTEPKKKEIIESFNCHSLKDLDNDTIRVNYDVLIYHMGNNFGYHKNIANAFFKFSGILELHDFSLHNYLAADTFVLNDIDGYINAVRYSHGERGVRIAQAFLDGKSGPPWETHALDLTVNKPFLNNAKGIIVHSEMAKQMVKGIEPNVPVINIPLHTPDISDNPLKQKAEAKKQLKISESTFVFGSFGYATRAKRVLQTLEALAIYKKMKTENFHYYIVGKVDDINVDDKVSELGLQNNVTVTGFTTLDDFKLYMNSCDICINLRYPTHGESSASLHRMFGMGKPVIVTKIGSFEEYPADIVIKVRYDEHEVQDIYNAICELTKDQVELAQRGEKALKFAKEYCDININAKRYTDFIKNVKNNTFQDCFMDTILDKLFELGLTDDSYIQHLLQDKQVNYEL
jgi:glycosyltransferase involved in cell wall biosynthesis